ncbi:MAG: pyridoxal phosphate-dependent aminotransferase [Acidimicrobiales bacterium]|nr:pyridoxal phosphate-dependent aminotransferase [Acidimicrobiales bacterium]
MTPRYLVERMRGFGETIFAEMSALAVETGAINLGQGFPDTDGPIQVSDAAIEAIRSGHNQYPPGIGIPELRHAVADHQHRFYGIDLDPDTEVLVTAGATEAIAAAILSLCEPGDEVVTFEPYYDSYAATVALAGATLRTVTLRPPEFDYDPAELEDAIGPDTRLILLNSPHNPTGKVFAPDELAHVARLAVEHDVLVVTDEVYEHMVFDGVHTPLETLPGMDERTLTISSAGKTLSFTGWKIGWVTGPAELVATVRTVKQYLTYVSGGPFQHAAAVGLRLGDDYFEGLTADLRARRDLLCDGLADVGFEVYRPAGTYFVVADILPFGTSDGRRFCLELPERCGVVAVPCEVFYQHPDRGRNLVRFTFTKRTEVLESAIDRLGALAG